MTCRDPDTYDTIIIGAGMSGLAAGIRLAYYDQRVCILERHTTIGGLNSFYRLKGRNYDVGLHAVTNFSPPGSKRGPLARLLRQLRFAWEEFALCPQRESRIAFPGVTLRFSNGSELLRSEVQRAFPTQKDRFEQLLSRILDYDELREQDFQRSARGFLSAIISDPLLVEMLLCPLMYYGNARERDMDFGQFCIMFRSIFLEGLARPWAGVRLILKKLVRRFRELGGDLRLNSGVERIAVRGSRAVGVVLEDGAALMGRHILSSAGHLETLRLCEDVSTVDERQAGRLSFVEAISILDRPPHELGHEATMVFFNDSPRFHWERPQGLVDTRSGIVCAPDNFAFDRLLPDAAMRVTVLANFDAWLALSPDEYRLAKLRVYDWLLHAAARFVPDFRSNVIDMDMFTPTTVRRFTGHVNGAVYGAPSKRLDGRTHLENLYLCGTDQGYVGIIGAILSGISIANRYLLPAA